MTFLERATATYQDRLRGATGPEAAFRARAWAEFESRGLPARSHEAWRYSSITAVTGVRGADVVAGDSTLPSPAVIELRERWRGEFDVLVVIDGRLRRDQSVIAADLDQAIGPAHFDHQPTLGDGFSSLVTAVSVAGLRLTLPPGQRLARPVLILHAQSAGAAWSPTLNQIELGENAELDLAVVHLGEGEYLRSEVTHVTLARGAQLTWVRLNQEDRRARHFSETSVTLAADATLNVAQINAGGAWTRASMLATVDGPGAAANMLGLMFGRDLQHIDQRIEVRHLAANTSSVQLFKGVLRDRARGILNGKIFIAPGAQKVSSSQTNHNLLLSPGAEANTHPELEIYADDVKANHGASIGRLDEDRIFYLTSRGLRRDLAQRMLAQAFVADVLMKITSPKLRRLAESRVEDFLPEFL